MTSADLSRERPTAGLEASYRACQQLARSAASNFYWAFWLLPRPQRLAMCALYAFARRADDLGDDDWRGDDGSEGHLTMGGAEIVGNHPIDRDAERSGDGSRQTRARRRAALEAWRGALRDAFAGRPSHPLLPAVADSVRRFGIPLEHLDAIIDGVLSDQEETRFVTRDDLRQYCLRVASAVGLACLHIWTDHPLAAYEPARECGIAFQITNILRDVREDACRGRVYLPDEVLASFQLTRDDLIAGDSRERRECLERLIVAETYRVEQSYARGWETRRYLDGGARRAFDLMYRTYHELLLVIRRAPREVLGGRVRVSRARKLWLAGVTLLGASLPCPVPSPHESSPPDSSPPDSSPPGESPPVPARPA